jgi:hypothetical protein
MVREVSDALRSSNNNKMAQSNQQSTTFFNPLQNKEQARICATMPLESLQTPFAHYPTKQSRNSPQWASKPQSASVAL